MLDERMGLLQSDFHRGNQPLPPQVSSFLPTTVELRPGIPWNACLSRIRSCCSIGPSLLTEWYALIEDGFPCLPAVPFASMTADCYRLMESRLMVGSLIDSIVIFAVLTWDMLCGSTGRFFVATQCHGMMERYGVTFTSIMSGLNLLI